MEKLRPQKRGKARVLMCAAYHSKVSLCRRAPKKIL